MIPWIMDELKSPEFWMSVAFIGVIFATVRPLVRYLTRWGQAQAATVRHNRDEAVAVRKRAEALLKHYESQNRHRESIRSRLLAEADTEIAFLERETEQRTADRIARKKQEVALRLKMITENGRQDVKNKMLNRIIRSARQELSLRQNNGQVTEDMDAVVNNALSALDEYAVILNK